MIYLIPFISAIIGWATNKIAITMLFYPRNRTFGIQGLIPKRKPDIAKKVGNIVENELVSMDEIINNLDKEKIHYHIKSVIVKFIENKLYLVSTFLTEETINNIVNSVCLSVFSEIKKEKNIKDIIKISEIIENKINSLDLLKLEGIIKQVANKELRAIEIMGGIIGFIIGLLQLLLLYGR